MASPQATRKAVRFEDQSADLQSELGAAPGVSVAGRPVLPRVALSGAEPAIHLTRQFLARRSRNAPWNTGKAHIQARTRSRSDQGISCH